MLKGAQPASDFAFPEYAKGCEMKFQARGTHGSQLHEGKQVHVLWEAGLSEDNWRRAHGGTLGTEKLCPQPAESDHRCSS